MIRQPALRELTAFCSGVLIAIGSMILGVRFWYGITYLNEWEAVRDVAIYATCNCDVSEVVYVH